VARTIEKLTIEGFKSIRRMEEFELGDLNVMIGANGAGKSNLIGVFDFVRAILNDVETAGFFDSYVKKHGGGDKFLYMGPKVTPSMRLRMYLTDSGSHGFNLDATVDGGLHYVESVHPAGGWNDGLRRPRRVSKARRAAERNWTTYHFHDTSDTSPVRRYCSRRDNEYLRADAGNLAAFLYRLGRKHEVEYRKIQETIQLAAPFFDDFLLRESVDDPDRTLLEWRQRGSDYPFHPGQLSDGTLRFVCLATALLQPEPPSVILLDEPELGMHPYALTLVSELIRKAARRTQVVVSTQSADLIDHFEPEDIVVVEREDEASVFKRLDRERLKDWLEDYTLGQLWQRNVLGGRPGA
jgi:predicted ATPase